MASQEQSGKGKNVIAIWVVLKITTVNLLIVTE